MPDRSVVITGLGVISPIGVAEDFWPAVQAGQCGIRPLAAWPAEASEAKLAGEVRGFKPQPFVRQRKSLKVMSRDIEFGVAAAEIACRDAGLQPGTVNPERFGVEFGAHTMHSELSDLTALYADCLTDGKFDFDKWNADALARMYPLWMLKYLPNMSACHIAINIDARGPNNSITQNEVSSLLAFQEAVRILERGAADVMISGGTGSRVHAKFWVSSQLYDDLSRESADPARACRPFDRDRTGQVNGEGAGAFVLEEAAHAKGRGAKVLARVLDYGATCETLPHNGQLTGTGIELATRAALRDAKLEPSQIGHVNANGLGTRIDDQVEAQAIARVLGNVPVFAPKSYFGNLGAGTGAVEMAMSVLALAHNSVPPTLAYEQADPACPIRVIAGEPLRSAPPIALVLNHTRRGQAAAVILAGA